MLYDCVICMIFGLLKESINGQSSNFLLFRVIRYVPTVFSAIVGGNHESQTNAKPLNLTKFVGSNTNSCEITNRQAHKASTFNLI